MSTDHRSRLREIRTLRQLVSYLRDEMSWPIAQDSFEDIDEMFFDFTAEELGIDAKNAAKIEEIKRLRPLSANQPWGIFFIKFEPKRLPVVALRRILSRVVLKQRASANSAERRAWAAGDLLFVSNYGEDDRRQITFAQFSEPQGGSEMPTLKVLGWDNLDTPLHLDDVAEKLTRDLAWPDDNTDVDAWRERWRGAFTLRHREVITTSKDLSINLAELARAIRDRIKTALAIETKTGPLTQLMNAFQEALVHDLDADGFANMYAQTIAYGLLSARIADPVKKTADDFAAHFRTNPFLRELMETFLQAGGRRGKTGEAGIDFDELGVSDVVELLDDANMGAVVRDFGDRNPQEDPVIHFYELFLAAYDKKQKAQRGVFYTPRPVVSYIVRSVDELLRTEFGLEDGLADTTTWGEMENRHKDLTTPEGISPDQAFIQILDPATGTGTFLVEVIDLIYKTTTESWKGEGNSSKRIEALWNEYVPEHLLPRLHGYELLMAPYAIAHLKIGLKLYETGYRFGSDERAKVFLTNALEPESDVGQMELEGILPALAHEAQAVNEIKRSQRFTVVIGNPPYSGHSRNNAVAWIVEKVYDYKRGYAELQKPGQAKWLQDDYVKFLRFAEWHVATSGTGIVGFITNHAWLDNPTFMGMRKHFLDTFGQRIVLDLHGNANRKEVAQDGSPDKNVFEIRQGVAISLLVQEAARHSDLSSFVQRSDLLGTDTFKFEQLMANSVRSLRSESFKVLPPEYIFSSRDEDRKTEYEEFQPLSAIFNQNGDPAPGIVTTHDQFAISFSRSEQIRKVEALIRTNTEEEARELFRLCSQKQWSYEDAKRELQDSDWKSEITPILYRPFDVRFTVYNRHVAVHRRERVSRHMLSGGNVGLSIPRSIEIKRGWEHVFCSRLIIQHHTVSIKEVNYLFPLYLEREWPEPGTVPNVSPAGASILADATAIEWNSEMEMPRGGRQDGPWDERGDLNAFFGPPDLFDYTYAILHSPEFRSRYAELLKSDFARIPLTPGDGLFRALIRFGAELVALHLMEAPKLDDFITTYTGQKLSEVGRIGWSDGTVWLDAAKTNAREGHRATKPGTIGFEGVPEEVWDFHIGGYQVCHKWLKDRKGRTLSEDDLAHYQKIIVALNDTIRIMREIDEVIEVHGGWPNAFEARLKASAEAVAQAKVIPFKPRIVEPHAKARYKTCVPIVPLKIAAGAFGDPQHLEDEQFEWVEVSTKHRLHPGMFVSQVVGKSMESLIPDGSYCLFRMPVEGSRQGKVVLVQLRDAFDPETGERYTVKRYESKKVAEADSWRHAEITLKPVNLDFAPMVLTSDDGSQLQVVAELVEVLGVDA